MVRKTFWGGYLDHSPVVPSNHLDKIEVIHSIDLSNR